jgi:hypothetical protein
MNTLAKTLAKPLPDATAAAAGADITTGDLLRVLARHKSKQLVFAFDGEVIRPGYHVTEVKDGRFSALDCGANPETWRETFIQLWDVAENPERGFMPAGRFLAIMEKVAEHVPFDPQAKLTFEVSDGEAAIRLFKAAAVDISSEDGFVRVQLVPHPASCKPRDRWLTQQDANACCGASSAKEPCCSPDRAA